MILARSKRVWRRAGLTIFYTYDKTVVSQSTDTSFFNPSEEHHSDSLLEMGSFRAVRAYIINAARGQHLVEDNLILALDDGHLAGATLDVFQTEPLPEDHPFWTHPRVTITPHTAADSFPEDVAPQLVENIRRALAGEDLLNVIDVGRGY